MCRARELFATMALCSLLVCGAILLLRACPPASAGEPIQGKLPASSKMKARIELGRRLFFDPQVSQSGRRSCASCHAPEHGFSDPDRGSTDDAGITPRHSQTILDAAWNPTAHWDGEFSCVEELVTRRLGTGVIYYGGPGRTPGIAPPPPPTTLADLAAVATPPPAPGAPVRKEKRRRFVRKTFPPANTRSSAVALRLQEARRYREGFLRAFGSEDVTLERLALAIAAYCYSIESTPAPYDAYKSGDDDALSASARRGLRLFEGRAGCFTCHSSKGRHPLFTDYAYHNTGIAWHQGHIAARSAQEGADGPTTTSLAPVRTPPMDAGRMRWSGRATEQRAFKTPTLRDVALRSPYMHDGRFASLEEVVRYYAKGCGDDPQKSEHLHAFDASEQEVQDLVAFLESLTGTERPGRAESAWSARARKTTLTLVDAAGEPLPDLPIKLVPVGDLQPLRGAPDETAVTGRTNKRGVATYRPGPRTHMQLVLPAGIHVDSGDWIPDTCRNVQVQVPVQGRMTFVVTFGRRVTPPAFLVAEHEPAQPGAAPLRTIFERTEFANGDQVLVARYAAWIRTDRSDTATLRIPGTQSTHERTYTLGAGLVRRIDLSGE